MTTGELLLRLREYCDGIQCGLMRREAADAIESQASTIHIVEEKYSDAQKVIRERDAESERLKAALAAVREQLETARGLLSEAYGVPVTLSGICLECEKAKSDLVATVSNASHPATCPPMTGEQLKDLWLRFATGERGLTCKGESYAWDMLAAHIWPQPVPNPREELRKKIVRTDPGEFLMVLELDGRFAVVQDIGFNREIWRWYIPKTTHGIAEASWDDAIRAAEDWLIEQHMKVSVPDAE